MFYVPDGTVKCGYYICQSCGYKFLDLSTEEWMVCPDCEADYDWELGPDEAMPEDKPTAKLQEIVENEDVEKMDALLSLAITGGNYEWI